MGWDRIWQSNKDVKGDYAKYDTIPERPVLRVLWKSGIFQPRLFKQVFFTDSVYGQVYEFAASGGDWLFNSGLPGFEPGFKFAIGPGKRFNNCHEDFLLYCFLHILFTIFIYKPVILIIMLLLLYSYKIMELEICTQE